MKSEEEITSLMGRFGIGRNKKAMDAETLQAIAVGEDNMV